MTKATPQTKERVDGDPRLGEPNKERGIEIGPPPVCLRRNAFLCCPVFRVMPTRGHVAGGLGACTEKNGDTRGRICSELNGCEEGLHLRSLSLSCAQQRKRTSQRFIFVSAPTRMVFPSSAETLKCEDAISSADKRQSWQPLSVSCTTAHAAS
jgi:hypothetical protein